MTRPIETLGKPDYTGQIVSLGQRTAALEGKIAPIESTQALAVARAQEAVEIASDALEAATGVSYTDEQARDAVGAALLGGDGIGITLNDPANTITIQVDNAQTLFNRLGLGTLATVSGTFAAGASVSGVNTGDQINITGNAGTATRLVTSRRINGVFFDGTGDITINAVDATPRQVQDADLDAIAALTTQPFGRNLLTYTDAPGVRSGLGLGAAALLNTGTTNGTVPLIGADNKLSPAIMPALAITDVFDVASQAEMLTLNAQRGDVAIRSDISNSYILATDDPTVLANWKEIKKPAGGGGTGTVTNVSVVTANGVSGSVQNPSTTPAITITLGAITPSSVAATGNITGANLSGTNTGDQTITLTGDVTGSGTGSFAATIGNGVVTLAKQANVATGTVFYRKSAGSGSPEVQTLATLKSDLGLSVATDALGAVTPAADRVPYFTSGTAAAVTTLTSYGRTLIALTDAAGLTAQINVVSTTAKGAVPQLPGNTTTFFRGDGTFATPPGEARAQTLCSVYDGTGSPTYDFYYADVAQTVSYKYLTNTSVTPAAVVMRSTAASPTSFSTVVSNPTNGQTGSFTMEAGASVYFMTASSGLHWLHLKRIA